MKRLKKLGMVTGLAAVLAGGTALSEEKSRILNFNGSVDHRNMYTVPGGFDIVDGPVTTASLSASHGSLDYFVWTALNHNKGNENFTVTEVDVGLGFSKSLGDFNARAGYEMWSFPKSGIDIYHMAKIDVNYNGFPIDLGVGVMTALNTDEHDTQLKFSASKTLDLGEVGSLKATLTPSITGVYLRDFFGFTGYSNTVYGASLGIGNDKIGFSTFVNLHNGETSRDGTISQGNDLEWGAGVSYSF